MNDSPKKILTGKDLPNLKKDLEAKNYIIHFVKLHKDSIAQLCGLFLKSFNEAHDECSHLFTIGNKIRPEFCS